MADEMKTFNLWVIRENLRRAFSLWDKWYVRQMELLNFMNCQASETSGKLGVRQVLWTSLFNWNSRLLAFDKKHFLRHQKSPLFCIKQTERAKKSRLQLKIFKEMVDEFRINNKALTLFAENHLHKKISQSFI